MVLCILNVSINKKPVFVLDVITSQNLPMKLNTTFTLPATSESYAFL